MCIVSKLHGPPQVAKQGQMPSISQNRKKRKNYPTLARRYDITNNTKS